MNAKEVGDSIKNLVDKISNYKSNNTSIRQHENYSSIDFPDENKTIDIFEVFYNDLTEKNNPIGSSVYKKVIFGLELISFWLFSSIWKAAKSNKYLLTGICLSGLILIAWYISVFCLMLVSISKKAGDASIPLPYSSSAIQTSSLFSFLSISLGVLPINTILRVAGFSMRYIKNPSLRNLIRRRIDSQVSKIVDSKEYDKVLIYSHSMGTILALDFFAEYQNNNETKLYSVSAGAPITFFSHKWKGLKEIKAKCAKNSSIEKWTDFFSKEDWLCSYEKANSMGNNFSSVLLKMDSSWLSRFTPKVHLQYSDMEPVINSIIN